MIKYKLRITNEEQAGFMPFDEHYTLKAEYVPRVGDRINLVFEDCVANSYEMRVNTALGGHCRVNEVMFDFIIRRFKALGIFNVKTTAFCAHVTAFRDVPKYAKDFRGH